MNTEKQLIDNYRKTVSECRNNISDTKKAIKELKRSDPTYKDKLTIKAYQRSIQWNRKQIKECREVIRNIKISSGKNYWTWIVLSLLCVLLAVAFPISIWTFAPLWGMLLIGFIVILIRTGK
jgi:hypothetical protein